MYFSLVCSLVAGAKLLSEYFNKKVLQHFISFRSRIKRKSRETFATNFSSRVSKKFQCK